MARINVPILLLSVALSTSAWFILYGQNLEFDTSTSVNLTDKNAVNKPPGLYIERIDPIKLQLSGPTGRVGQVMNDHRDFSGIVNVDLTNATAGTRPYPLIFDRSISDVVQSPKTARVVLEEIVNRTVQVKVEPRGKLNDPNSSLTSYPASESSVNVTGPKSLVDEISVARAILQVDQIDTNDPKPQDAPLVAVDSNGKTEFSKDIMLQPDRVTIVPIVSAAQVDKMVIVSVNIQGAVAPGYVASSYKVVPNELQLTGPTATLANLSSVKTEKVDVSGLTETKEFKVRIITPRGTGPRTAMATVTYFVKRDPSLKPTSPTSPAASTTIPPITPPTQQVGP